MRRTARNMVVAMIAAMIMNHGGSHVPSVSAQGTEGKTPTSYSEPTYGRQANKPWWHEFHDPILDKLIEDSLKGNFDVKAAHQRVIEAEALSRRNLAPLLPSFSVDVNANMSPLDSMRSQISTGSQPSGTGQPANIDMPYLFYTGAALLKAGIQVDIWGRHYLNYSASKWETNAQTFDADEQAVKLATLITEVYFDTVAAKARVALLQQQLENNSVLLSLMKQRFELGQVTALDVLQQEQQVAAAQALLPTSQVVVETGIQQLKVLKGISVQGQLSIPVNKLPELPPPPKTGTPKNLADNLPALRSQKARLRAAEHRADSAFRGLLPSLSVSGDVGYQAWYIDEFDGQETWGVGAILSIPLWQGGANHAALDQANAQKRAAQYSLAQATLRAIAEVESALTREKSQREQLLSVEKQLKAAQLAYQEARERYLAGLDSYLNVLTALNIHQQVQLNALMSQRDLIMNRLRLYQSLGGPWTKGLATRTRGPK